MNRMLMLSGATILALATGGAANAASQILDCHDANGRVVTCAANFKHTEPGVDVSHVWHQTMTRSTTPTEEQITVVGARPDRDAIPTDSPLATPSLRPGAGGDWVPVVATSFEDKLQQWNDTYLNGEGLLSKLHY